MINDVTTLTEEERERRTRRLLARVERSRDEYFHTLLAAWTPGRSSFRSTGGLTGSLAVPAQVEPQAEEADGAEANIDREQDHRVGERRAAHHAEVLEHLLARARDAVLERLVARDLVDLSPVDLHERLEAAAEEQERQDDHDADDRRDVHAATETRDHVAKPDGAAVDEDHDELHVQVRVEAVADANEQENRDEEHDRQQDLHRDLAHVLREVPRDEMVEARAVLADDDRQLHGDRDKRRVGGAKGLVHDREEEGADEVLDPRLVQVELKVDEPDDERDEERLEDRGAERQLVAHEAHDVARREDADLAERVQARVRVRVVVVGEHDLEARAVVARADAVGCLPTMLSPGFFESLDTRDPRRVRRLVQHHELPHEVVRR
ncbi:hypothetical protein PybrP1_007528, partial [[Pythium] brassicae (nom. inval.)]